MILTIIKITFGIIFLMAGLVLGCLITRPIESSCDDIHSGIFTVLGLSYCLFLIIKGLTLIF